MQDNKYWFFGSKLNTVLLLILIILMVVAIRIMRRNEALYFPGLVKNQTEQTKDDWKKYPLDIIPAEQYSTELVLGNKDDLISFSVFPNSKVSGKLLIQGIIKGGYFFEANILINILDANKKLLKTSHATAMDDWMTSAPVKFQGDLDFVGIPKGKAYIEIHNDNASDLPENNKSILVPIVIQ